MTTHATITLQIAGEEIHANMGADAAPRGFGDALRAIADAVSVGSLNPGPVDLKNAFFSPVERSMGELSAGLRGTLGTAFHPFERTEVRDQLGDAWYRYEIAEREGKVFVTAFGREYNDNGYPSLTLGWKQLFFGDLSTFLRWAQRYDPEREGSV